MTDILADLVSYRTVTGDKQAADKCLDYIEDYLSSHGMFVKRSEYRGFPCLVATTRDTKEPKVLLQAHIDVVAAPGKCFTLKQKDGRLQGRGVFDMKFAAAVFLKIVDELSGGISDYDFGLMFTSDEEVGGKDGVKALLDDGYRAEVCLLPDAGDDWRLQTSHKGCWTVKACARGRAAHGSRPWEGENAIERLMDALADIRQLFKGQNSDSDTLTIAQISGGEVINQVADKAEAVLDVRFVDEQSYRRVHDELEHIFKRHGVTMKTVRLTSIAKTDTSHALVVSFMQVARKIYGQPLGEIRSLGTSDACYFAEQGIPVILCRPAGGSQHADDEWISAEGFEKYYSVVLGYIKEVAANA